MTSHEKLQTILAKISALAAEAQALSADAPPRRHAPSSNEQIESMIRDQYDFNSRDGKWKTCAAVCYEIGIEQTRANCSMVGRCLSSMGVSSRRSSGKNLVFVPPETEKF